MKARLLAGLMLALAGGSALATGSDAVDPEIAACPGGAEWFNKEHARRSALQLPAEPTPTRPELRDELLRMERTDQEARAAMLRGNGPDPEPGKRLAKVDEDNLKSLKRIVDADGFPEASEVGRDGVAAAWLLVQHADRDPEFQERMLEDIRKLGEQDGIDLQKIALLTDRVLLARGKPQVYGSQFEGGFGKPLVLRPVESPELLDQRRADMHLMPLATYRCLLENMQAAKPDKQAGP